MTSSESTIRDDLLSEVRRFVEAARNCPGVRRIALVGSLTTNKATPKDADVLVTMDDDADLTRLATLGRRLKGRAQSKNSGADIFLADPTGNYMGRISVWNCPVTSRLCLFSRLIQITGEASPILSCYRMNGAGAVSSSNRHPKQQLDFLRDR